MPTIKPCSSKRLGSQASSVQVMATEYNSVYANPGKQSTSLVNGLFVAESLGSLLDSGYSGGFVWDLRNYWDTSENNSNLLYGWREGGDYGQSGRSERTNSAPATGPYVAYPGYYALQLASKIIQSGGQVVSAASNYSDLDVYAVMEPSGDLELLGDQCQSGRQPHRAIRSRRAFSRAARRRSGNMARPRTRPRAKRKRGVGPGQHEHDVEPQRQQFQLHLSRLFDDRSRPFAASKPQRPGDGDGGLRRLSPSAARRRSR